MKLKKIEPVRWPHDPLPESEKKAFIKAINHLIEVHNAWLDDTFKCDHIDKVIDPFTRYEFFCDFCPKCGSRIWDYTITPTGETRTWNPKRG